MEITQQESMIGNNDFINQQLKDKEKRQTCDALIQSPDSRAVQIFVFILILFALVSTLCAAFYACFGPPENEALKVFDYIMEAWFGLDILRNFLMQYDDIEQ